MRVVFMGTPHFAVPVLSGLHEQRSTEIAGVFTPPDRPRGRGQEPTPSPVKAAALEMGLPVLQPVSLRRDGVQRELENLRPDVVVVAAYGKLLPPEVLELPPLGCLNIHPSLLPRYRGPSPVVETILDGLETTGVTLMLLDEGMDTGPIVAQREHKLSGTETAGTLTEELFQLGTELLLENLDAWAAGRLEALSQEDALASVTAKLERSDGMADWSLSALQLERRQRAFTPWPGLFTYWQGKSLRLLEVVAPVALPGFEDGAEVGPGEVAALAGDEVPIGIGTGGGVLGVKTLQLEGRRAMSAADFLRGYPNFLGSTL